MITNTAAQQAFLTELNSAPDAASRAQVLYDLIRVAYDRTKLSSPETKALMAVPDPSGTPSAKYLTPRLSRSTI